ncbi:MAG: hypothetical protein KF812_07480 [Fimbriimonadaceae bacterium]|nr:hypothetical protein [Fimbriimonadaceae bacterium]
MGSMIAAMLVTLALASASVSHRIIQHQRLRREVAITWRQIDALIEQRQHTEAAQEVIAINHKISDVAQFHNQTVEKANECLDSLSGRLLRHIKGLRRLSPYETGQDC